MSVPAAPLLILDAISPFMRDVGRHRVNWSKIDFAALEPDGEAAPAILEACTGDLVRYCDRIAADGANGIAFDDLPHLYLHPTYPAALRAKLQTYRAYYRRWMEIARAAGLSVYLNADILFYHPVLEKEVGFRPGAVADFLAAVCATVLDEFPLVRGIFFRLGECDGVDVRGDFISHLVLRTAAEANALLQRILPVFEARQRACILRTWTVGAYPIGDLMWNPQTLAETLRGIDSPSLILSMKYGETDFFRYLPLNPHFFATPVAKLIELQTKREYEGAGEYPSFVGYDYEAFRRDLAGAENVLGAHIWCQSGGWTCFRRLTYLQPEAVWNEINTFVTLRVFRDGLGVEEAVQAYARERLPAAPPALLIELLRLSDEVVKELLYLDDYARERIYFRRSRLPPQMMVYWDHIFVNHTLRKVLRGFVREPAAKIRQAQAALEKIQQMRRLAVRCGLPAEDLDFMYDTFGLLAAARKYVLLPYTPARAESLAGLKIRYQQRYPHRYRYAVKLDFGRQRLRRARIHWLMRLLLRRERPYRRLDKIFTIWLLGKLYPLLRLGGRRFLGGFAGKQAMGLGTIFK
jgi:hypothetical protein